MKHQTNNEGACHEHAHFASATEALKHEHRVIEKVLGSLERLADPEREFSAEQWRKILEFIRGFADQCHHHKEEKLLFPALEEHGIPVEGGPIGVMLVEHEEGRGYVKGMVDALALAETDPQTAKKILVTNAESYLRLLREHIRKEDDILFHIADEILSPEEQERLAREFEEHEEQEIGVGVHDKYLRIAHELEASVRGAGFLRSYCRAE
ncbi:MAG TPA: hemerythrin domain-containing protein [Candidatus Acidoferrales bacterium]|nr:hemerythrin domain-containing protein [Candidatus Acidoferrales bacterium]